MNSFEEKGYWWLPEYPDDKVVGTLKFSTETGIFLELMGDFQDRTPWKTDENGIKSKTYYANTNTYSFIIGENFVEKKFTVYKAYKASSSGNLSDSTLRVSLYKGFYLFPNCHLTKEEELFFNTFRLEYHCLAEWVGVSGFSGGTRYGCGTIDNPFVFEELDLKYKYPETIKYKIEPIKTKSGIEKIDLSIYFIFHDKSVGIKQILEQKTFIEVKIDKSIFFYDFLEEIKNPIETFFMFILRKNMYLLNIFVQNDSLKNSLQVFYENEKPFDYKEVLLTSNYFIKYEHIKENFSQYITNWFVKSSNLKPVFDLYFGSVYNNEMYLQNKFLSLAQALEVYHRRLLRKPDLSKEELKKRKKIILDAFPEYKEWLEPRLNHNEISLKDKLEELKEIVKPIIEKFTSNLDSLSKEIADRRNYLTHYDEKAEKKYNNLREFNEFILGLSSNMKMILDVLFLKEIGLDDNKIKEIIDKSSFIYYSKYIS